MKHEHEKKDTFEEDVFYPDHPNPRAESSTFRRTKSEGHREKTPCCISGHQDEVEYHHVFCEWAFADAVDWETVKGVATGTVLELPVLNPHTDQPTGETYPAKDSLLWMICKLVEIRGFKWEDFDPAKPETFVDSMENMLPLQAKFHRHKNHGIHMMTFPEWQFQAWPRKNGFVFTPDEE